MSSNYKGYSVDYRVQGQDITFPLDTISFSMIDSIYSLYNRAVLHVNDQSGFFQEAFFSSPGVKHELTFSYLDKKISGKYVVVKPQVQEQATYGAVAGQVSMNLVSDWSFDQPNRQKSYKDRISNIIRKLAGDKFGNNLDINDTGNMSVWIQGGQTDAAFIQNILLPNAYSQNAAGSPFYAWVGNDGQFHFRNYLSLFRSVGQTDDDLFYTPQLAQPGKNNTRVTNSFLQLRPFSKQPTVQYKTAQFYTVPLESGIAVKTQDSILNHPQVAGQKRPQVLSDVLRSIPLGFSRKNLLDNFSGQQAFFFRDSLMLDKLFGLLPTSLNLNAGKKVSVTTNLNVNGSTSPSVRHSGEYLIELAEHVWSVSDRTGYTKVLLSRATQQIPSDVTMGGFFS